VGITAGSREVPGRNACDKRHIYCIIIIIIIIITDETIDHSISACPILAKEQYMKRYDRVCALLLFSIYKETGVQLVKNAGMNMCQNQ